jgi:hypothetical protein
MSDLVWHPTMKCFVNSATDETATENAAKLSDSDNKIKESFPRIVKDILGASKEDMRTAKSKVDEAVKALRVKDAGLESEIKWAVYESMRTFSGGLWGR